MKKIKIGVIVGNKNNGGWGKLFLSDQNDRRVDVSFIRTNDEDDFAFLWT